jgi:hypothetical protein
VKRRLLLKGVAGKAEKEIERRTNEETGIKMPGIQPRPL